MMIDRILRSVLLALLLGAMTANSASSGVGIDEPCSALEFRIDPDFDLSTFEGTAISWKRLSSPSRGWRLGFSPLARSESRDLPNDETEHRRMYSLEIKAMALFLSPLEERTRFYWGAGPLAGYSYQETERLAPELSFRPDRSLELNRTWFLGAGALVGVEYFFANRMSLMGEYGLDIRYERIWETRYSRYKSKVWQVNSRSARLGLSVLF